MNATMAKRKTDEKPDEKPAPRGGSHYLKATGKKTVAIHFEPDQIQALRLFAVQQGYTHLATWLHDLALKEAKIENDEN